MTMNKIKLYLAALILVTVLAPSSGSTAVLFQEQFEDTNFSARGWYDNTGLQLSSAEHVPGSTRSVEFHFLTGGTTPTSGLAMRRKFTETESAYISFYIKYSSNWDGSNKPYHPHIFAMVTNVDGDWIGAAYSHLTAYIEANEGEPLLAIQDGRNIDETQVNVDLTGVTENRALAGCNGDSDGYGNMSCYPMGAVHWNWKQWKAGGIYFQDAPGPYYKNDWHLVEAYFKLNSIVGGKGVADGIIRYWYDGQLIIDHSDVMLRTAQHPNQKFNQLILAPWIGDGSPVDQKFWIDNLTFATSRTSDSLAPSPPTNVQAQ